MKLKRNEIAAIKRVAATVQPLLNKKDKLKQQIADLQRQLDEKDAEIRVWEQGIRNLTGFGIEELVTKEVVNGNTRFIVREDILEEEPEETAKGWTMEPAEEISEPMEPISEEQENNLF